MYRVPKHRENAIGPPRFPRIVTSGSSIGTCGAGHVGSRPGDPWAMTPRALAPIFDSWITRPRRVPSVTNLPCDEATSSPDPWRLGTETIEYREEPSRVSSASFARARPSSDTLAPFISFWTPALFAAARSHTRSAPKLPHSARISRLRRAGRYDLQAQLMSRHNRRGPAADVRERKIFDGTSRERDAKVSAVGWNARVVTLLQN